MNTVSKIIVIGAASLATALGTARIVSKVAKQQEESFFPEHAENEMNLGGSFDLGSINHFERNATTQPEEPEPVQDVAFEDENGNFVALPTTEEMVFEDIYSDSREEPASKEPVVAPQAALTQEAEAQPAARTAPETEAQPAAQTAPETEGKPAVQPLPQAVAGPAAQQDAETEVSPEAQAAPEAVAEPAAQPSAKAEVQPSPQAEAEPEAQPAPQEKAEAQVAPQAQPHKKETIMVGSAVVSADTSNGFIQLVSATTGKTPESLVVLAAPKAEVMVFSFADAKERNENTMDAVYFVSQDGTVSEPPAGEKENVMAFGRTFISRNEDFKKFLAQ